jgi:hypothetical protein
MATPPPAPKPVPSETIEGDLVEVINKTAHIENIANQVILNYCGPRSDAREFMWSVVLDTSVMSFGAKLKVVLAVAQEVHVKADREALQRVVALRNAFVHHATYAYPVLNEGPTPERTTQYNMLWVLQTSGRTARLKRHEAFEEFLLSYRSAKESLLEIKREVQASLER